MNALQARLAALTPRERVIVIAGGVVVAITAFYLLVLSPLHAAVDARSRRVADKQGDLAWLQSSLAEVQSLSASQPQVAAPSGESLVVLIDRTARESDLGAALTGQTPSGDAGMRVRLESAPFDTVVRWLGQLELQGIDIESATIDRTGSPGLVNATLTLVRAGGG